MFVPCTAGLCIENQHCALGFVNVSFTNAALVINTLMKPSVQCWVSMHMHSFLAINLETVIHVEDMFVYFWQN
jgi:nucleosome binding factor SPN SPT16 subunit